MTPHLAKLHAEWERRQELLDLMARDRRRARLGEAVETVAALSESFTPALAPRAFSDGGRGVRPERRCKALHSSGARCRLSSGRHEHRTWSRTGPTLTWFDERAAA